MLSFTINVVLFFSSCIFFVKVLGVCFVLNAAFNIPKNIMSELTDFVQAVHDH